MDDDGCEGPAAIADAAPSGRRVTREPTETIGRRGQPDVIDGEHGTSLASNAILAQAEQQKITWRTTAPGSPTRSPPPARGAA